MNVLNLREPVSAMSHGLWFLMILPAAVLLWTRGRGNRAREISLCVYAVCLAFCALASTLYHGVVVPKEQVAQYLLLDHIGIYLLIAGTYTPIAVMLMQGAWRRWTLTATWLAAAVGILLNLTVSSLPNWLSTCLYLCMGWGALICYLELARNYSQRILSPIPIGGVIYSVGALIHLFHWPVLWPGVLGGHDLFHVLVMVASAVHFAFILAIMSHPERYTQPVLKSSELAAARSVLTTTGASLVIDNHRGFGAKLPHISTWIRVRPRRGR